MGSNPDLSNWYPDENEPRQDQNNSCSVMYVPRAGSVQDKEDVEHVKSTMDFDRTSSDVKEDEIENKKEVSPKNKDEFSFQNSPQNDSARISVKSSTHYMD